MNKLNASNTLFSNKRTVFLVMIFCAASLVFLYGSNRYPVFRAPLHLAFNSTFETQQTGSADESLNGGRSRYVSTEKTQPLSKSPPKTSMRTNSSPAVLTPDMPSIRGTAITVEEINRLFDKCQTTAIQKDKTCATVLQNSTRYWRSVKTKGFSYSEDYSRINKAITCCAYKLYELIAPTPSNDMFPWERDYLSKGPLRDIDDAAWASKSSFQLADDKNRTYYVGDDVRFIIRLQTGRNQPRRIGGDSVRLWLVNERIGASVTANVKDNGDGSYLATSKLPWSGKVVAKATIAHTRELFRSTLYVQRLFTTLSWLNGKFENAKASEGTPCSPLPHLPGFQPWEVCNLTEHNGGIDWYCGKPIKKDLQCSDIKGVMTFGLREAQPLTDADQTWTYLTESQRPFLIPSKLELTVEKKRGSNLTTLPLPRLECKDRDLTTTFTEPMSTGYLYQHKWRPFACRLPSITTAWARECLKNTTVIVIGDSNTRAQFYLLEDLTKCTETVKRHRGSWHTPLSCEIKKDRMSIQFYPHKLPFYGHRNELMNKEKLTSAIAKMDSIPAKGRYIINLHYFLHLMPFHPAIARTRLQRIRPAIARLVARNPTAFVVIQTPHAAYDRSKKNKHKLNVFILEITRSVLSGLGKQVMFLNTMDITIADENTEGHPKIAVEFMNSYLGHFCKR